MKADPDSLVRNDIAVWLALLTAAELVWALGDARSSDGALDVEQLLAPLALVGVPMVLYALAAVARSRGLRILLLLIATVWISPMLYVILPLLNIFLGGWAIVEEIRHGTESPEPSARPAVCSNCGSLLDASSRGQHGRLHLRVVDVQRGDGKLSITGEWLGGIWPHGSTLMVVGPAGVRGRFDIRLGEATDRDDGCVDALADTSRPEVLAAGICLWGEP